MGSTVRRIFTERKKGFDTDAGILLKDLKSNLGIQGLTNVRIANRYDIEGISDEDYRISLSTFFSQPLCENIYEEIFVINKDERFIAIEYLPGQYDQKADSLAMALQILNGRDKPIVKTARIIVLCGQIEDHELIRAKEYLINPIESREAAEKKPESLKMETEAPGGISSVEGFISMDDGELRQLIKAMDLAMAFEDLALCRQYFKETEKRDPTITEIKVLDTYWSDHCRHTTFLTHLNNIRIEDGENIYGKKIREALDMYFSIKGRNGDVSGKPVTLMDMATLGMKELKRTGHLDNLDESDEINASGIRVNIEVDSRMEEWIVMFKNETHNHPTEMEPFGGAATCLGGAIRDPLSGRSYVYQAMRVTGCGNPLTPVEDTIKGKLPQRKITISAADGYSSYGNQVGVAAGHVQEIYHDGYVAKRMELGAVVGAAPASAVVRQNPVADDVVILLGGRTGRDGLGGATGSSREHTGQSLEECAAEVQKGNPPTEKMIQRLFRKESVSRLIKRCNDFGAGGVAVAIGELAPGLEVNLDAVLKKYEGMDGTEIALSESQERMAVVLSPDNVHRFVTEAARENLEATPVAIVTENPRLNILWRGKPIVSISREFLNSNGATRSMEPVIGVPDTGKNPFRAGFQGYELTDFWLRNLKDFNVCSQKGLVERFDSSGGAGTVLMPFGGSYQLSPQEGMAGKIPVKEAFTNACTLMSFGFDPEISTWSPFHGAVYAIVEAVSKIVAMGGNYGRIRLSLQEYFEKLSDDPIKWGKPLSALLGALYAQMEFNIPSIGGKDSMSGTYSDSDLEISVPPTLVAFALDVGNAENVVSTDFKKAGSAVYFIPAPRDKYELPDFKRLRENYDRIFQLGEKRKILAASAVKTGGIAATISKMCFGSMIGFRFDDQAYEDYGDILFDPGYGGLVLEINECEEPCEIFQGIDYVFIGKTEGTPNIHVGNNEIPLDRALIAWMDTLESVFPTKAEDLGDVEEDEIGDLFENRGTAAKKTNLETIGKPRVFIPVFPGTTGEYDGTEAFLKAGGGVDTLVFRNLSPKDISESISAMAEKIRGAQIIMIPGGSCHGDDPLGTAKFVTAAFMDPYIKEAIEGFLERDGLILGIGNGFSALLKLGLVPFGKMVPGDRQNPVLTSNLIGRHVSLMVNTRVISNNSPWLSLTTQGDIYTIPVSHGAGRFMCTRKDYDLMKENGQIATCYVDRKGNPTYDIRYNPNGSFMAIEGITSPCGRIFGKMGHSERVGEGIAGNVPGIMDQRIFEAGIRYFK